jgi:hypothetical protein
MISPRRVFAMLILVSGCAGARQGQSAPAQDRQRDVLTRDEIQSSAQAEMDLFQAIRSLRPRFLQPPPGVRTAASTATGLAVYIERNRQQGIDVLRTIPARTVQEVRYLDPAKSTSEFGPLAGSGAIVIRMYTGPAAPSGRRDTTAAGVVDR